MLHFFFFFYYCIAYFFSYGDQFIVQRMVLQEGSDMMKSYREPPVNPLLQVYFFNVTNPQQFLAGAKPKLQEVGPYVYKWVVMVTVFLRMGSLKKKK